MDEAKELSLGKRLFDAGLVKSHAYALAADANDGKLSLRRALDAYRETKIKIGPLAAMDDAVVNMLLAA